MSAPWTERVAVATQHLLPKQALTALAGRIAGAEGGALSTALIRWFIGRYGVDMAEAANADPGAYASFNDFFTRALKPGVRPLAQADWLCPVDGAISQFGRIQAGQIFQAKGHDYSVTDLLGGDRTRAKPFIGGDFATIYLAPKDYHRIHMPISGTLKEMVYVPGKLFSVNPATAERVPRLFARNERVVAIFDTELGPMAMVLVGAMIVASIETVWAGLVAPLQRTIRATSYQQQAPIHLVKGQEMGRFKLGSTVVLCFPKDTCQFDPTLTEGSTLRMGTKMGNCAR